MYVYHISMYTSVKYIYVYICQLPVRKGNVHMIILVCLHFSPSHHISPLFVICVVSHVYVMIMVGSWEIDKHMGKSQV